MMTHLQHGSEPEIILWNMAVKDDEKAFEEVFKLFYPALSVYAKRIIEDQHICEDIVQDVFVSLWEDRKRLSITTSLRSYLLVAVKNKCFNYIKKKSLTRQYQESLSKDSFAIDENEDSIYTLKELYDILEQSLSKLPESYRIVFEMHRMEGKKYEEIAEKLNLSVRTVKRYNNCAIEILKNDLKDYLPLMMLFVV